MTDTPLCEQEFDYATIGRSALGIIADNFAARLLLGTCIALNRVPVRAQNSTVGAMVSQRRKPLVINRRFGFLIFGSILLTSAQMAQAAHENKTKQNRFS